MWRTGMNESALNTLLISFENSRALLDSQLWWATFSVVVGVGLEWMFVIWEYREEWSDFRRGIIHPPERPNTWLFVLGLIATSLITVGVAGEMYLGAKISVVETKIRKANDERAKLLSKEANDALERASANEKEAAQLRKDAESEHLARAKIESMVSFRSLDTQQKREIGHALSRFGNITGVSIWYANGSLEAESFADDIAEALRSAHIHTTTVGGIVEMREGGGNWDKPIDPASTGVDISSTTNPLAQELAASLLKEIADRGFDAIRRADQPIKGNQPPGPIVWITVQGRPKGPQGRYKLQAEREAKTKPLNR